MDAEWHLEYCPKKRWRRVATVWPNGTWHTWDKNGTGGWNDIAPTVGQARLAAAGAALLQGFIMPELEATEHSPPPFKV
jgi:hypothetical protein